MTRRRNLTITALVALAVVSASCKGDSRTAAPPAAGNVQSAAPKVSLASGTVRGVKVGLVVSSAGPGADVRDLAAGAYVAAFRLNGATDAHDRVALVVRDDNGTPEGATAAIDELAAEGVVGVVYASTGEQVLAGVVRAAQAGLAVVLPYADDPRVTDQGATSFLAGPTIEQVGAELASHVKDEAFATVALVRQAGPYGDAGKAALATAGLTPAIDIAFTPGDALAGLAQKVVAATPAAVIVWAEAGPALAAADALSAAGATASMLFANRAAVPTFARTLATALAPSVGDGAVSVGTWGGPETPTAAVDAFYLARDRAVSDGGVSADLGLADLRSHDALLALVRAASLSEQRGGVPDALRTLGSTAANGSAGIPLDFSSQRAVSDDAVALLAFSTIDDGTGRYPATTGGGHWLAVAGTYTPPDALKGLDDPYGG